MLIRPADGGAGLGSDVVTRVILRTDMTPIPATIEIEARRIAQVERILSEGQRILVGDAKGEFTIIKSQQVANNSPLQGEYPTSGLKVIGMLSSCEPIARRLQRSVIRENAPLGEIYRACGAQVRIGSDFNVPRFSCFVGMTPSFEVAKVLQEEAGALIYADGAVTYRRLGELIAQSAALTVPDAATEILSSDFLERHAVPFAFSTDAAGAIVSGRREASRGVHYQPRADQRIVNNLGQALLQRRKMRTAFTPSLQAGSRIDVGSSRMVVITAAHVFDAIGGDQYTQAWLGELSS